MVQDTATSVMTEGEFWDKFHKKHNPRFYEKLKKKKTKSTKKTGRPQSTKQNPVFKVSD